jgi:hypothetical protein
MPVVLSPEANERIRKSLNAALSLLEQVPWDDISTAVMGGILLHESNFRIRPLSETLALMGHEKLDVLLFDDVERLLGIADRVLIWTRKAAAINAQTTSEEMQKLRSESEHLGSVGSQIVLPLAAFVMARRGQVHSAVMEVLSKNYSDAEAARQRLQAEILKQLGDTRQAYENVVNAAKIKGITAGAETFQKAATRFKHAGAAWLVATIASAVALAFWIFRARSTVLWPASVPPDLGLQIEAVVARVVPSAALAVVALFCAKGYRTAAHNRVIAEHRYNACLTFLELVQAAGTDATTKGAILLQATTAIFALQSTGYTEPDPVVPAIGAMLDAAKSVAGTKPAP